MRQPFGPLSSRCFKGSIPKSKQHTSISIRIGGGGFFNALISQRSRMERMPDAGAAPPGPASALWGKQANSSLRPRARTGVLDGSGLDDRGCSARSALREERCEPQRELPEHFAGVRRGPDAVLSRLEALRPPPRSAGVKASGTEAHSPTSCTSVLASSSSGAASVHSWRAASEPSWGAMASRWSFTAQTVASSCCLSWSSCSSMPGGKSAVGDIRRLPTPSASCLNSSTFDCSSLASNSVESRARCSSCNSDSNLCCTSPAIWRSSSNLLLSSCSLLLSSC
mmetsp:Transcript_78520/g.182187  ORF Transcript_78520/g.182187 Transcript_78520/m.182187 type:complete len:282 (+) Transcript_78520:344-1189(+)